MVEKRDAKLAAGFALVEILIAILILGTSLVTLLSLQSSAVQRALRDRNQKNAMLVARSVMSAIEIDPDQVETQDTTMPAGEMIAQLIRSQRDRQDQEIQDFLNTFEANLRVEEVFIPLPGQEPILMKKVLLILYWGDGPAEQMQTVYFVPEDLRP